MNKLDSAVAAYKLPSLRISTARSNTAKLRDMTYLQNSELESQSSYFVHSHNDSSSMPPYYMDANISLLCQKILREQNELKVKINQQAKLIKQIYKRKPPIPCIVENCLINDENKEVTFKPEMWPQSAKGTKRLKFPREVFTRKTKTRRDA